jgi:hypothetical protein
LVFSWNFRQYEVTSVFAKSWISLHNRLSH